MDQDHNHSTLNLMAICNFLVIVAALLFLTAFRGAFDFLVVLSSIQISLLYFFPAIEGTLTKIQNLVIRFILIIYFLCGFMGMTRIALTYGKDVLRGLPDGTSLVKIRDVVYVSFFKITFLKNFFMFRWKLLYSTGFFSFHR